MLPKSGSTRLRIPIRSRRLADIAPEYTAKIGRVFKAHERGNISDTVIGLAEEFFSLRNAIAVDVFPQRQTQFLMEDLCQIVFADPNRPGNFSAGYRLGIILVNIRDSSLCQRAGLSRQRLVIEQDPLQR